MDDEWLGCIGARAGATYSFCTWCSCIEAIKGFVPRGCPVVEAVLEQDSRRFG
jgi:hypothetical protein